MTAVQKLVPRPSTLQHASKRPYAPKEGGAKAVGAILKMLSVVALLLGAGLVVAGLATSSVGVGGIILGAILFVAGLVVLIDVSKY
ncbi:hypothetical protein MUN84_09155 [Hymenobacter sp. 5516J-16]|uniref:hypothetical protein n=1 Tax=Hymenobacter sp. 5516J-16 TaxID=2932253 RepID=UPI001FD5A244|nr:hypothetical protein [Hymenobacter sp. 5516J-16]UOQ78676.1 hypothetical protein MUN84_09155 [Hymenobacter sp. 5516J-16]